MLRFRRERRLSRNDCCLNVFGYSDEREHRQDGDGQPLVTQS